MINGKFALRHNCVLQCHTGRPISKAKAMVEYFCQGGSVANVMRMIEGQLPSVNTLRDFADDMAIRLAKKASSIKGYIDGKSKALIVVAEGLNRKDLQECVNQTGCTIQVSERGGTFHLAIAPLKIKEMYSPAQAESADRLSNECGIFYEEATRYALKKDTKRIPCPACHSEKTKVESKQVKCLSCDYQGHPAALSYVRCSACGLLEAKTSKQCSHCKHNLSETLTATAVGGSVAQTGKATGILPGSCPNCGGTVIGVGDMFKCLSCNENIAPDKLQDIEKEEQDQEYTLVPEEETPDEIKQDDPEKLQVNPNDPGNPELLNEFVVLVKNNHQQAYEQLLDAGFIPPGTAVLARTKRGWQEVSMPDDDFVISTNDEEMAHKIHDTLLSHGFDAEIANPDDLGKDEKMGYPGHRTQASTFDYENPGGVVPESKNISGFSMVEHLQSSLTIEEVNAQLAKTGHGPINRKQLDWTRHLYAKRAGMAEIMQKTGISESALKVIIGA